MESDFRHIDEHCRGRFSRYENFAHVTSGRVGLLSSEAEAFGFYTTILDLLLEYMQVGTLVVTAIAANICVLFTANDVYMRDYKLLVPSDCVASSAADETMYSLRHMKNRLKADIRAISEIGLGSLMAENPDGRCSDPDILAEVK